MFFKQKLGITNAASANDAVFNGTKTANGTKSNELFNELSYLSRRLEFIEEQSEERTKATSMEHVPCRREIEKLTQELGDERDARNRITSKKNAEIAYFKAELDALMA